ncbi:type II toxin-antitoxin system PemK/MazF family toxin [Haliea sp. E1-2-M8]|uniref:type II toxin-antitoxin system PemK/MazF family toxin n=1 Tax=Haliea sp. E1-2-M8 TaxID=3064706 RepID=UPI00271DD9CC|nr:type II toxin-antitoxin system PemK/MazF family toxin [Haliea sp. E1-2-M8]MDO8863483.1 type II toxin-antitoxin system PemK/MazF family toxin [Haliea sp. E1-2-M8]
MTFECFDVVVVPFPFTDRSTEKRRPALVLSAGARFNVAAGHAVMAMITSARHSSWPLDVEIKHLQNTGLSAASLVRMKLFTLDLRLVIRKAGALHAEDASRVREAVGKLFGQG